MDAGALYRSTDSGRTWAQLPQPEEVEAPGNPWVALAADRSGERLVAAAKRAVFTSADGGATWIPRWRIGYAGGAFLSVASSPDGRVLLAAAEEQRLFLGATFPVYRNAQFGNSFWSDVAPSDEAPFRWRQVLTTADSTMLLAGALPGALLRGEGRPPPEWAPQGGAAEGVAEWIAAAMSDDGARMAAIGSGTVYYGSSSSSAWSQSDLTLPHGTALACSADGAFMLASEFQRNDTAIVEEPQPEGDDGPAPALPPTPATGTGRLYASSDAGATWAACGGAPDLGWSAVAVAQDASLLAAGGGGLVYTSTDRGVTWEAPCLPSLPSPAPSPSPSPSPAATPASSPPPAPSPPPDALLLPPPQPPTYASQHQQQRRRSLRGRREGERQ